MKMNKLKLIIALGIALAMSEAKCAGERDLLSPLSRGPSAAPSMTRSAVSFGGMPDLTYKQFAEIYKEPSRTLFVTSNFDVFRDNYRVLVERYGKEMVDARAIHAFVDAGFFYLNVPVSKSDEAGITQRTKNLAWFLLKFVPESRSWQVSFARAVSDSDPKAVLADGNNSPASALLRTMRDTPSALTDIATEPASTLFRIFRELAPRYAAARSAPAADTFAIFERIFVDMAGDHLFQRAKQALSDKAVLERQIATLRSQQQSEVRVVAGNASTGGYTRLDDERQPLNSGGNVQEPKRSELSWCDYLAGVFCCRGCC